MATAPAEREFPALRRGHVRDKIVLANFRIGLRQLVNPETGQLCSADEITRATQPKTRFYIEAQAIDDFAQSEQRRAGFMFDQIQVDRCATNYLEGFHARLWGKPKLAATSGSFQAVMTAVPGTRVYGSTTINDPTAYKCRDGTGKKYQVWTTVTWDSAADLVTLKAIDTGVDSVQSGDSLTWYQKDPNMGETLTAATDAAGGTDTETDAEQVSRILGGIRHHEAAGNDPQLAAWGREALNAVERAFVYPCALHAGSVIIAVTQKRGGASGPEARIPTADTLSAVTAYLVPPNSPVVPTPSHILVTPVNAQESDIVMRLSMPVASAGGWTDLQPFPAYHATTPAITGLTSQTEFEITATADDYLPGGATTLVGDDAPGLMVWDESTSRFCQLEIASVTRTGSGIFDVVLTVPASVTLATGSIVCPDSARRDDMALAIEAYFDDLGPGDLFDVSADPRGARCVRFPRNTEEYSFRAGALVATRVIEALGGIAADGDLPVAPSRTEPDYPTTLTDGPNMVTLGTVGVYSF